MDNPICLTCLFCDRATSINDCLTNTAPCRDRDEECFLDQTVLLDLSRVFSAGCRSKQMCDHLLKDLRYTHGQGRRAIGDIDVCAACCNTNQCNAEDCRSLRKKKKTKRSNSTSNNRYPRSIIVHQIIDIHAP
ncbi:uncharacterized protein LOC127708233 [Mytilus californianus]|uniref:uncharacterized protein LOC127708233 n=1 Tax=Mytilus californianus TaxID=6549 RepID=UPI00224627AC|nr:uncharacterized protein LOC127708233 [Mytilus californianus]